MDTIFIVRWRWSDIHILETMMLVMWSKLPFVISLLFCEQFAVILIGILNECRIRYKSNLNWAFK